MKIYGDMQSGNCYKIALLCSLLEIDHQWIEIDILKSETQTTDFLQKNPNGKIPLLEFLDQEDKPDYLTESNAILNFLADDSDLLPSEPLARARVLQWQFFEQYSHEPYIAVARYINKYLGLPSERQAEYLAKQNGGHKALQIMQQQLEVSNYLCGNNLTIADISLFAYTHVAHEGGFELAQYPAIRQWIHRIEQMNRFVAMSQ